MVHDVVLVTFNYRHDPFGFLSKGRFYHLPFVPCVEPAFSSKEENVCFNKWDLYIFGSNTIDKIYINQKVVTSPTTQPDFLGYSAVQLQENQLYIEGNALRVNHT